MATSRSNTQSVLFKAKERKRRQVRTRPAAEDPQVWCSWRDRIDRPAKAAPDAISGKPGGQAVQASSWMTTRNAVTYVLSTVVWLGEYCGP